MNRDPMNKSNAPLLSGSALLSGAVLLSAPALGAQVHVQPIVSVAAQTSSNVDLEQASERSQTEGYFADAAAVVGIATPRSETTFRPRLLYREYPDDSRLNRLEAFLDFATQYKSQRSRFSMFGRLDHRDQVNAERSDARFNEVTPVLPTTPETGRITVGATRDLLLLVPSYSYELSQRTDIGASATLQRIDYSPDDSNSHVDFDYYQGKGFVGWNLDQRTKLSVGGFASKYDAIDIDSQSTSYGVGVDLGKNWSPVLDSTLSITYQRTDIERTQPTLFEDKANAWGANFGTAYSGQTSRVRFDIGRQITPSGGGGLYESDQVRLQYERDVTQRLEFTAAGRYLRNRALSRDTVGNDRDYSRAEAGLRYMATRTFFIEASYEYTWQEYENAAASAADHSFALRFGYRGLPRQRG